jgi:hypothetical protein
LSTTPANVARVRRRLLGLGTLACALIALAVALGLPGGGSRASGQGVAQKDYFYTEAAMPADDVMMFGASPREAPNEAWGYGKAGQGTPNYVILRYATGAGWTRAPAIQNGSGQPLEGFAPASGVLAGAMTPDGSGVLAGTVAKSDVLLVRNPGQPFAETSAEPVAEEGEGALLRSGEELFAAKAPLVAALEEGTLAGALVVPGGEASAAAPEPAVLHWEGQAHSWTREKIELPAGRRSQRLRARRDRRELSDQRLAAGAPVVELGSGLAVPAPARRGRIARELGAGLARRRPSGGGAADGGQ